MSQRIHEDNGVQHIGAPLEQAKAAVIMIHGRGGGTQSILPLAKHISADDVAYLAPAANNLTWYPQRFLAPRDANEPFLSSALNMIDELITQVTDAGIPTEKIMILGFSQGACLSLEYAARNPQRFGALVAFSGGLIGADNELTGYDGSLQDTPVFIGCSDVDFHIPVERVHESAKLLGELGAEVDARIYPNMGHTINQDEVEAATTLLQALVD